MCTRRPTLAGFRPSPEPRRECPRYSPLATRAISWEQQTRINPNVYRTQRMMPARDSHEVPPLDETAGRDEPSKNQSVRARTTSFARNRPRSVRTRRPFRSSSRPSSRNGAARSASTSVARTPADGSQAEEHRLQAEGVVVEELVAADGLGAGLHRPEVLLGRADVPPPAAVAPGVGAGAEAEVRAALPVAEVVAALAARAGPSSRPRSARSRRRRAARRPARTCRPGRRRRAPASARLDRPAERRRGFDREGVRGDVFGRSSIVCSSGPRHDVERLAVRAEDQVEVHVVEARASGVGERASDGRRLVDPFQRREHRRVERLRAHRQPVDAAGPQCGEGPVSTVSGLASTVTSASSSMSNASPKARADR